MTALRKLIAAVKGGVVATFALNQFPDQATGTLVEFLPLYGFKPDLIAGDFAKLANVA